MRLLIQVIIIPLASTFLVLCLLHAGEGPTMRMVWRTLDALTT